MDFGSFSIDYIFVLCWPAVQAYILIVLCSFSNHQELEQKKNFSHVHVTNLMVLLSSCYYAKRKLRELHNVLTVACIS